jgi:hypothetical protein
VRVLVTKGPLEKAVRAGIGFLIQQVGVMLVDDLNRIAEPFGHAGGVARMRSSQSKMMIKSLRPCVESIDP